jgi:hypothetical protein
MAVAFPAVEDGNPRFRRFRSGKATTMATCDLCGNDYDKTFRIVDAGGGEHVFDSFECAIATLAPECAHCGCRIVGHGTEADGKVFCCAHCAQATGVTALRDRV